MNRISFRLGLGALALMVSALALTGCRIFCKPDEAKAETGFIKLFNGHDLSGWDGLPDHWDVREGVLTGYTTKYNPLKNNSFLVWKDGTVGNFELRLQYRIFGGNSGIQYRSTLLDPTNYIVGGYQADFEAGKTYSGILYEERGRGILAERGQRTVIKEESGQTRITVESRFGDSKEIQSMIRDEDWNDYVVVANGNHLTHFINGHMTADVVDLQASKAAKSGILALQIHVGPPMMVQFRDIRLRRIE